MKRILCIWLPEWSLQRLAAKRLELDKGPLHASHETKGARHAPSSLSPSGRGAGGEAGEPSDPVADREALTRLAEWCRRFSPLVGLEETAAPESLLLDITNLADLFGGEEGLVRQILHAFTRWGLVVRAAVADTLGAAWAVAHFGKGEGGRGKAERCAPHAAMEPAKPQAAFHHPPSTFHLPPSAFRLPPSAFRLPPSAFRFPPSAFRLPPGEHLDALRPLPVEALRLSEEVIDLLHQLGIYQIGQVESLPREDLTARFGPQLLKRLDQAAGRLAEPVPALPLRPELETQRSLEYPTTHREAIEKVFEELIGEVTRILICLGRGAVELECRLRCEGSQEASFSVGLFQPSVLARHLFQLVCMRLEQVVLPAAVSAVQVRVSVTGPLPRRQRELFCDGLLEEDPRHLADLVDRLSSRLGRRAVLGVRLVPDAQPELAYRYDPLVAEGGKRPHRNRTWETRCHELPPRPLRLARRPIPIEAVSVLPDGPPVHFHWQHEEHRIARCWGPERIETGWWRGRTVGRDYWRVETARGSRFWLFCRLRDEKWFLHGVFE